MRKDKSLEELFRERKISVRLFNALRISHMTTIGDVIDYIEQGNKLINIRRLGKASQEELHEFLASNHFEDGENAISDKEEEYLGIPLEERNAFENSLKASEKVATFLAEKTSDIPAFYHWLYSHTDGIVKPIASFGRDGNVLFRHCIAYILNKHLEHMKKCGDDSLADAIEKTESLRDAICRKVDYFTDYDEYLLSSDSKKQYIERNYHALCNDKLSNRARSFLRKNNVGPSALIKLFDSPVDEYNNLCPGSYNKIILSEIYALNKVFKEVFGHCIGLTDAEIKEGDG